MESNQSSEEGQTLATNGTVDAVVAVLVFLLGVLVVFGSRQLGAEWGDDGPGAGYFPFYIGVILCISGLGVLYQTLRAKGKAKAKNAEAFVDRESLGRVLAVLLPAIVYVGAVDLIGIYVASAIYITLFMVYLGKYGWLKSVIVGLAVNILFFLMFEVWFKVPLHKGTFDPLSFLGY